MWHAADVARTTSQSVGDADLNRTRRDDDLARAVDTVSDVVVVGGGVTGAGIALDAASRGLSVTLVEARDLAYGTSRWSSKLVHGGLRYLAHGDFGVAWESARERHRLMTAIAPHLVRPLPHVLVHPRYQSRSRDAVVRAGLAGADGLRRLAGTPRSVLPGARRLRIETVSDLIPGIDEQRTRGGVGYWDGQLIDDARLVIAIARTAAAHGARILTRMRATQVSGNEVLVHDTLRGGTHHLRARHVVIAVGIWSGSWDDDLPMHLSRGTHVLVRPDALGNPRVALTVPVSEGKSRYVFALPQLDGPLIAGLTDVAADNVSPDDTHPPQGEIDWVLDQLSSVLRTPLSSTDVMGAYSGYRPLVGSPVSSGHDSGESTADISRQHLIHRRADGVTIVTGGKLTTYRKMAQDAIDSLGLATSACRTATLPLVGANVNPEAADQRLVRRYGSEAARIEELARESGLQDVMTGTDGVVGAEIAHAIRHEGALTVDDIVQRRTRLSVQPELAASARPAIAALARSLDPDIVDFDVDP